MGEGVKGNGATGGLGVGEGVKGEGATGSGVGKGVVGPSTLSRYHRSYEVKQPKISSDLEDTRIFSVPLPIVYVS